MSIDQIQQFPLIMEEGIPLDEKILVTFIDIGEILNFQLLQLLLDVANIFLTVFPDAIVTDPSEDVVGVEKYLLTFASVSDNFAHDHVDDAFTPLSQGKGEIDVMFLSMIAIEFAYVSRVQPCLLNLFAFDGQCVPNHLVFLDF